MFNPEAVWRHDGPSRWIVVGGATSRSVSLKAGQKPF